MLAFAPFLLSLSPPTATTNQQDSNARLGTIGWSDSNGAGTFGGYSVNRPDAPAAPVKGAGVPGLEETTSVEVVWVAPNAHGVPIDSYELDVDGDVKTLDATDLQYVLGGTAARRRPSLARSSEGRRRSLEVLCSGLGWLGGFVDKLYPGCV